MASKTIDIAVVVKDAASSNLDKIEQKLKSTSSAAKAFAKSFGKLNSTMISTNKAMQGVTKTHESIGKELRRLEKNLSSTYQKLGATAAKLQKLGNAGKKAKTGLQSASKGMKKLNTATKEGKNSFLEFNRTIFTTTAFIGLFAVAFGKLKDSMLEAAKMDRIASQFEKTVGPKGDLIKAISGMTDNSIDIMESMKAGIALRSLGIAKSTGKIAEFVSRAGTAAKLAGMESGEGIKQFTAFMKDGSVAHLEFLNLISRNNAGFKIGQAILSKYGGIAGGALTASQRLAIGQSALRMATAGAMKGQRDYADTLLDVQQFSKLAAKEGIMTLVAAFAPLLEKLKDGMITFMGFAENLRKTDKETLFFIKTAALATTAVAGLFAAFGTLKLATVALTSVGIGIPALAAAVGVLGFAFISITSSADNFMERLKVMGAVFKGTFQLIKSFFQEGNFEKGVGSMDKALADLLKKHDLYDFVQQVSRALLTSAMFLRGFANGAKEAIDFIVDKVGGLGKKMLEILGIDPGAWSRFWVEGIEDIGKSVGKLTVGILAVVAAFKSFKMIKGILGKLPLIGKFFGGGKGSDTQGPRGTKSDPIYTQSAYSGLGVNPSVGGGGEKGIFKKLSTLLSPKNLIGKITIGAAAAVGGALVLNKVREALKSDSDKKKEAVKFRDSKPSTFNETAALGASGAVAGGLGMFNISTAASNLARELKLAARIAAPSLSTVGRGAMVAGRGVMAFTRAVFRPIMYLEMFVGVLKGVHDNFKEFKEVLNMLNFRIQYGVNTSLEWLEERLDSLSFSNVADWATSAKDSIVSGFKDIFMGIVEWLKQEFPSAAKIFDKVEETISKMGGAVDEIKNSEAVGTISNVLDFYGTGAGVVANEAANSSSVMDIMRFGREVLFPAGQAVAETGKEALLNPIDAAAEGTGNIIGGAHGALNVSDTIAMAANRQAGFLNKGLMPKETMAIGEDEDSRMKQMTATHRNLSGEKKKRYQDAMMEATKQGTESGSVITAAEMHKIMQYTIGQKVEWLTEETKAVKENTTKTVNDNMARGGGC